jgi:pilus assembly protein CpaF
MDRVIVPFIRPIEPLLHDDAITEIMVIAGGQRVFVERHGSIERVDGLVLPERHLNVAITNIARACGADVSTAQPILDARLEDGARVAAVIRPVAVDGATLTIRRHPRRYRLDDLIANTTLTPAEAAYLVAAIAAKRNVLISGGAGTGKTTLLNALGVHIPEEDRIIVIEDTAEIQLPHVHAVRWEARRAQLPFGQEEALPAITIADLVRALVRHRPDRVIIGEVRGDEAFYLLQALNTGHEGSISTIHANSASHALHTRLAHLVLTANVGLSLPNIREAIGLAIHVVAHIARDGARRRLTEVLVLEGYDARQDRFALTPALGTKGAATGSMLHMPSGSPLDRSRDCEAGHAFLAARRGPVSAPHDERPERPLTEMPIVGHTAAASTHAPRGAECCISSHAPRQCGEHCPTVLAPGDTV